MPEKSISKAFCALITKPDLIHPEGFTARERARGAVMGEG